MNNVFGTQQYRLTHPSWTDHHFFVMQITSFHFSLTVTTPQALIDGANIWTGKLYEKKRGDSRLTRPTTLTPRTLYRFLYWFWEKTRLFCSLSVSRLWGGARVVQWWKHSPPTNVARVQIRVLTPCVTEFVVGSPLCSEWFSLGTPVFPSPQNPIFRIPVGQGMLDQESLRWCAISQSLYILLIL